MLVNVLQASHPIGVLWYSPCTFCNLLLSPTVLPSPDISLAFPSHCAKKKKSCVLSSPPALLWASQLNSSLNWSLNLPGDTMKLLATESRCCFLLSSATAQGSPAVYQDSTSTAQEGLCSKIFKFWSLLQNRVWIGAHCWQATYSLEASSNPQATIYYILQGREILSCCRGGEEKEMFYMNKVLGA